MITPSDFVVNFEGLLSDARLERRGKRLWNQLSLTPCSSIRRISSDNAEQKANYRFLNNERVTEQALPAEAARGMQRMCGGRHLLCIQDTSEINLSSHQGRLAAESGLGRSDKADGGPCFKVHPGLVLEAESMNPLGFSPIKMFHRPQALPDKRQRNYARQPIEEKESYKWLEVAQASKQILQNAASVPFIEDREGDIYEQFARIPIDWKLLTTHSVEDFSQALQMVRWYIEQLFRLLKKQGFDLEQTQLETGWAIRKLAVMQRTALLKILQMNIAYSQPEGGQPIQEVFDPEQIEALHLLNTKLQGKTPNNKTRTTRPEPNGQRGSWLVWAVGKDMILRGHRV